jgi:hypothetical protein
MVFQGYVFWTMNFLFQITVCLLRHKTPHVAGFKVFVKKNPQIYKYVAGLPKTSYNDLSKIAEKER